MANRTYRKTPRELADYTPGDNLREQIEQHRADHGERCSFVASPCLTPDFDVLDNRQTAYYLFVRECIRNGTPVRSDAGYTWLLMVDLINDRADPMSVMRQFGKLYEAVNRRRVEGYPPADVLSDLMYCYAIANDIDLPRIRTSDSLFRRILISEVLHPFPELLTREELHTVIGYPLERYYGHVDDVDAFELFDAALPAVDDRLRETTGKGILETYSIGSKTVPIRLFSIMGSERLYFYDSRYLITYTDTGEPLQTFLGAMYRYCHRVLEKDAGLGNGPSVASVFGSDLRKIVDRVFCHGNIVKPAKHDKTVRGSIRAVAGDVVVPEVVRIQSDRRYMLTSAFHSELSRYTDAEPNGPCDYVSSGCKTPQPSRMTAEELQYYLYWRSLAREGRYGKTDRGYIWLYQCELINDPRGPDYVLDKLAGLGRAYDGLLSDSWGGARDPPGRTYLEYAFVRCPRIPDPTVYPCNLSACDMAEAIIRGEDIPLSSENFMILSDIGRSTTSDISFRNSFTYDCAGIAARVLKRIDRDGSVQGRVDSYCGLRKKIVRMEVFRGLKYYDWPGGFQRMQERPMTDFVGNVLFQDGMREIVRSVVKAVGVRGRKPRDARAFGVGLSDIVLEETDRWFSERGAAAVVSKARDLAFDQAGIRRAEDDLDRVTELIGMGAEDHGAVATQHIPEERPPVPVQSGDPWADLVARLDGIQKEYLRKALAGSLPVAKPIMEGSINGIAMDAVKDTVIEDGKVFDEYAPDLERALGRSGL